MKSRLSASKRAKAVSSKADSQKIALPPSPRGLRSPKATRSEETYLPTYPPLLGHWESLVELSESGNETPE